MHGGWTSHKKRMVDQKFKSAAALGMSLEMLALADF